jgi:hypothetical protein
LTLAQPTGQSRNRIFKTDGFEKLPVSIVIAQSRMLGVVDGDTVFTICPPWVIQATSSRKPMLHVEPAALEVPASGLLRMCTLHAPQMNAALLHQVRMQMRITREPGTYLR